VTNNNVSICENKDSLKMKPCMYCTVEPLNETLNLRHQFEKLVVFFLFATPQSEAMQMLQNHWLKSYRFFGGGGLGVDALQTTR
jgi:hypothetical protein